MSFVRNTRRSPPPQHLFDMDGADREPSVRTWAQGSFDDAFANPFPPHPHSGRQPSWTHESADGSGNSRLTSSGTIVFVLLLLGILFNAFSAYPGLLSDPSAATTPSSHDPQLRKELREFERAKMQMQREREAWKLEEERLKKQKAQEHKLQKQREAMKKEQERWEKEKQAIEAKRAKLKMKAEDPPKVKAGDGETKVNDENKVEVKKSWNWKKLFGG